MSSTSNKYVSTDFPANAAKEQMDREGKGKKFDSADWFLQQTKRWRNWRESRRRKCRQKTRMIFIGIMYNRRLLLPDYRLRVVAKADAVRGALDDAPEEEPPPENPPLDPQVFP